MLLIAATCSLLLGLNGGSGQNSAEGSLLVIALLFASALLFGVFIPLSLLLQGVLTLSPTGASALITALSVSLTLGAALVGLSISRRKRYQLTAIVGAASMTIGLFLLASMAGTGSFLLIGLALVLVGAENAPENPTRKERKSDTKRRYAG